MGCGSGLKGRGSRFGTFSLWGFWAATGDGWGEGLGMRKKLRDFRFWGEAAEKTTKLKAKQESNSKRETS